MKSLDLEGIRSHALCSEHSTIEGNLRLPDLTLQVVEDNAMFLGFLHQLEEVLVMLLRGITIDAYIIMYDEYAREIVCCLVHSHLKDVLGHLQTEWHMQKPVSAMMHPESGQIQRFLF